MEKLIENQIQFIREHVKEQNKSGVILGLSGGIDSAVVAALAVRALGADKVHALILPDVDSADTTVEDARLVADSLGIKNIQVKDISPLIKTIGAYDLFPELYNGLDRNQRGEQIVKMKAEIVKKNTGDQDFLSYYRTNALKRLRDIRALWNTKIRLRMTSIYMEAERHNLLVLGTTNRTEYELGWFTKYGDGGVDIELLYPLYKNKVFALAKVLNIPEKIINKKPSGDILPGVDDESGIGVPYEILDEVLAQLSKNTSPEKIAAQLKVSMDTIQKIDGLIKSSRFNKIVPVNFLSEEIV